MSRKGGRKDKGEERIEPRFGDAPHSARDDALRADPATRAGGPPGGSSRRPSRRKTGKKAGKSGKRRSRSTPGLLRRLVYWGAVAAVWALLAVVGIIAYYAADLPQISDLKVPQREPNVVIVAASGEVLATRGMGHGADVRIQEMPPYLAQAIIAIEDRRFRSHFGVDPIGLVRALARNVITGRVVEGGSTITQQLAKNLFLVPERTIKRKVQEMILALWLEHEYSKDEILELYLNRVYFGAGTYGVEAAAQRFFGKPARRLTLSEAAVLAGLLAAPTRYAPTRNPDLAEDRAFLVLRAMVEEGYISLSEGQHAVDNPSHKPTGQRLAGANYIADWVSDLLPGFVGQPGTDIVVETSIDPRLQRLAEKAVGDVLDEEGDAYRVQQGALLAMDGNGGVKAVVGGRDYLKSQFNRAIKAMRQPGSSFKPFVYLTALERGLTPETVREDKPVRIGQWQPANFTGRFEGPMTLRRALSHSINTIAVQLALEVGPANVAKTAHRLGITAPLHNNATLALGSAEVTLLDITAAYVPFANGGHGVLPHIIRRVRTTDGEVLYQRSGSGPGRVVDPVHVGAMNDMLAEALDTGTGKVASFGWPAGGKTGTSQEFRDAWFIGYTANLTAGVWVGNDDATPTDKASGSNLPAMIWNRFMAAAHEGLPVAALPGNYQRPGSTPPAAPVATVDRWDDPAMPVAPYARPEAERSGGGFLDSGFLRRIFGG